jgi:hypothetical protein
MQKTSMTHYNINKQLSQRTEKSSNVAIMNGMCYPTKAIFSKLNVLAIYD